MPKEGGKSGPGSGTLRSARRREELRRAIPKPAIDVRGLFLRRESVNAMLIFLLFWLATGALTLYSRNELRLDPGQVMSETRINRVRFVLEDEATTNQMRSDAIKNAPHVYGLNDPYLANLHDELLNLPAAIENVNSVEEVDPALRERFKLTQEHLDKLKKHVAEGEISEQWSQWVEGVVVRGLPEFPTIPAADVQEQKLRVPEFIRGGTPVRTNEFVGVGQEEPTAARERLRRIVSRQAGVPSDIAPVFIARLEHDPKPIYLKDDQATRKREIEAAANIQPRLVTHPVGEVIYKRGDVLRAEQIDLARHEQREYHRRMTTAEKITEVGGTFGLVALITVFMSGYLIRFYPRVLRNAWRVTAIAVITALMLLLAASFSEYVPKIMHPTAMATTLFVGFMLVIAYDQRLATMMCGMLAALMTLALNQSAGFFVMLIASAWSAIAALRQVRHRNAIIRAAVIAGGMGALAAMILGMIEIPIRSNGDPITGAWTQMGSTAALGFAFCLMTGFILLGILPSIEKMFDMTTGMTLVELRDPRMPLLRQLQERAPGTYNHSIAVANIAEAAADTIGADGLLTYVGALYHDIGKMNKPDYFVENQSEGANKHHKLSPAMSLLVIVGHVKDGVELAREYGLPSALLHFIASHHGTTLVEYFYHAAKARAEAEGERDKVTEIEFRYPGPKPRTREAAILMIADACESAARAVQDPNPGSMENLVRKLTRRRLDDGQFDESDITLRELTLIEDSVIKSLLSLHHSRISYPSKEDSPTKAAKLPDTRQLERRTSA